MTEQELIEEILEHYSELTEEKLLESVKRNGNTILFIRNPSLEVQWEAVKQNAYSLMYIDNPSCKLILEAVRHSARCIKFVKNPSLEIQLKAIAENANAIDYIRNPHPCLKVFLKYHPEEKLRQLVLVR